MHDGSGQRNSSALRLRALRVQRDAHRRGAVALRVHEVDRRFVARHEPLVRVRRRVGEREHRRRVLQQPADVPARHVGETGVALLVEEQRLAALPQRLVHVHARAVVLEQRLRHERHRLARARARRSSRRTCRASACRPSTPACRSACRSRPGPRCRPRGAAPRSGCRPPPACSIISERRSWNWSIGGTGKYPSLYRGLYAEVRSAVELALATGVPHALDRVEEVVARELVLVEAHRVEDVELGFGPEVRGVGDAGATRGTSSAFFAM